jgi:tetratricopeptide (TPR) repeat protein
MNRKSILLVTMFMLAAGYSAFCGENPPRQTPGQAPKQPSAEDLKKLEKIQKERQKHQEMKISGSASKQYSTILKIWEKGIDRLIIDDLDTAVKQYPEDQKLAFFLASCLRAVGNFPAANALLDKVIELKAASPEGKCASLLKECDAMLQGFQQGANITETEAKLKEFEKHSGKSPLFRWMYAQELSIFNKQADAAQQLQKLMEKLEPGSPLVHEMYTNLLIKQGNNEEMLKYAVNLAQSTGEPWAFCLMGHCWAGLNGQETNMQAAFDQAVKLAPNRADTYISWGNAFLKRNNLGQALPKFQKALEVAPNSKAAMVTLANIYLNTKKFNEAADILEKAVAQEPENVNALSTLGEVYTALKQPEKAMPPLKKALELDPKNQKALFGLANYYTAAKNFKEAIPYLEKISEQAPQDMGVLNALGNGYFTAEDYEKAYTVYEKMVNLKVGDQPIIRFNLAITAAALNKQEKAISELQACLLEGGVKADMLNLAQFQMLKTNPEFQKILQEMKAKQK